MREELVASRCCCGSAAAAAAKIRYQMGERERRREREGEGLTDPNGAIRHLLACDADKSGTDGPTL